MPPRYLLDTHVVLQWLSDKRRLTQEQVRVLSDAERRSLPFALSAVSLLEIALLSTDKRLRLKGSLSDIFAILDPNPAFQIFPVTFDIASEFAALRNGLPDPMDRVIVATARVHRLRLVTSDQRIIGSKLVSVVG